MLSLSDLFTGNDPRQTWTNTEEGKALGLEYTRLFYIYKSKMAALSFLLEDKDSSAMNVGAVSHAYEEMVAAHEQFKAQSKMCDNTYQEWLQLQGRKTRPAHGSGPLSDSEIEELIRKSN